MDVHILSEPFEGNLHVSWPLTPKYSSGCFLLIRIFSYITPASDQLQ